MDNVIKQYDFEPDNDLNLCLRQGVGYQNKIGKHKKYDNYFEYCQEKYNNKEMADKINNGRIKLVNKYIKNEKLLDIGIGSGEFIQRRKNTFGVDIDKTAIQWLIDNRKFSSDYSKFSAFSMWDVLEHLDTPEMYFKRIKYKSFLFLAIPIMKDLMKIRESKHYRPNEHFYYFTEKGLIYYLKEYGFEFLEKQDFELQAGRQEIYNYVFRKRSLSQNELILQYKKLHIQQYYGHSSVEYLEKLLPIIKKEKIKTILDFGCGRSDLVTYFYKDGLRKVFKYDPAIPKYKDLPKLEKIDLILCTDVLEHIPKEELGSLFKIIRNKSKKVIFSVSCIPARKKLLNGINAHVTLEPIKWWVKLIKQYFEICNIIWEREEGKTFLCKTF